MRCAHGTGHFFNAIKLTWWRLHVDARLPMKFNLFYFNVSLWFKVNIKGWIFKRFHPRCIYKALLTIFILTKC